MKVLVVISNPNEACSFYRAAGPWSALAKQDREIQVGYTKNAMWADVRQVDVLFLQRAASNDYAKIARMAKDFGVPLWLDYDDDLLNIPLDNPMHGYYSKHLELIKELISMADLVTVTTAALKAAYAKYNKKVEVVPNALDDSLLKFYSLENKNKFVMWRGTQTHTRDVGSVAKELVQCMKALQEFTYVTLGADPCAWMVSEHMKKVFRLVEDMDPITFFRTMVALRPEILVVPLHNCPLNRAKSNIAAIEGALAGAAILAPNWPEWRIPGVVTYGNNDDFRDALSQMMSGQINTASKSLQTWGHVRENLLLSKVNEKRKSLLYGLLSSNEVGLPAGVRACPPAREAPKQ